LRSLESLPPEGPSETEGNRTNKTKIEKTFRFSHTRPRSFDLIIYLSFVFIPSGRAKTDYFVSISAFVTALGGPLRFMFNRLDRIPPRNVFLAIALLAFFLFLFVFFQQDGDLSPLAHNHPHHQTMDQKTKLKTENNSESFEPRPSPPVEPLNFPNPANRNRRVHVFYYPWYGNPATDETGWSHWDHSIIPHWDATTRKQFKYDVKYVPPLDIGAMFYPERGPYSSADPAVVERHMAELQNYVVVVSWWGIDYGSALLL
jgi:hypothetical protein